MPDSVRQRCSSSAEICPSWQFEENKSHSAKKQKVKIRQTATVQQNQDQWHKRCFWSPSNPKSINVSQSSNQKHTASFVLAASTRLLCAQEDDQLRLHQKSVLTSSEILYWSVCEETSLRTQIKLSKKPDFCLCPFMLNGGICSQILVFKYYLNSHNTCTNPPVIIYF